jgi:lysophospholipase L1-like esterase
MLQAADDPQAGLRSAILAVKNPSLSLVIILAGTNDLAFEEDAQVIIDNVIALHKISHLEGIRRTIAIGVPPSAWQASNEKSRTMASKINEALEEYCTSTKAVEGAATSDADVAEVVAVASYFPFPFGWSHGDSNWSPDGLHLSPEGYAELGTQIAPFVSDVLSELQSDIQLS